MKIALTDNEISIFKKVAAAAENTGVECYVIGGFVRDKILGRPTKDIDIVCVGDGIALAEETAKQFDHLPQVNIFKTYGTAQLKFGIQSLNLWAHEKRATILRAATRW
jgi:poly(A) polymerase